MLNVSNLISAGAVPKTPLGELILLHKFILLRYSVEYECSLSSCPATLVSKNMNVHVSLERLVVVVVVVVLVVVVVVVVVVIQCGV